MRAWFDERAAGIDDREPPGRSRSRPTAARTRFAAGGSFIALCVLLFAVRCGGGQVPEDPSALCSIPRQAAGTGGARPVRPNHWMNLLLKGFRFRRDAKGQLDFRAHYDCIGESIVWPAPPADCPAPPPDRPSPARLEESSVIERRLPDGDRLVWVITHRYADGDGLGPVALATVSDRRLSVRALGHYRGRTGRVQMRLWSIGQGEVLVVEGERCQQPDKPATCEREAGVMVLDRDRFAVVPIRDREGKCIEPARVEFRRQAEMSIESGTVRRFEFSASIGHDVRYLVVTEQIDINDFDPTQSGLPPRHVRRVDTERFIHLQGRELVSRQQPLWRRMMPTRGFTELTVGDFE